MTEARLLPELAGQAAGFLAWWLDELRGMLPRRLRRGSTPVVLDLSRGSPRLAKLSRKGLRDLAPFPVPQGQAGPRRLLAGQNRIAVLLPSSWLLRRVLQLPAAAEQRLDAVLGFELEQHVPFEASDVMWTTRILRRLPEAQRIEVEVAVLPRSLVAPLAAQLRRSAGTAELVARQSLTEEWPAISLDRLAAARPRWRRRIEVALACSAVLLAFQLSQADLRRAEDQALAAEARAARARGAAERVMQLEAETASLRARLASAAELRGGRPPAIAVIEELAQRLPDDVWLTELRLAGDQLVLSGFAARADTLLELLGTSPIFEQARFTAPVTRAARETADRFQVTLRVAPAMTLAGDATGTAAR